MARDFVAASSQSLTVTDSSSLSFTSGGLSIAARVDLDLAEATICHKYGASGLEYIIGQIDTTNLLYWLVYDSTSAGYRGRTAPEATGAQNLVVTYDGGTANSGLKIYRNGSQVDTADFGSGTFVQMRDTAQNFLIGSGVNSLGTGYIDGRMSELALYAGELTLADVSSLNAGMSPLLVRTDILAHYWPLRGNDDPEPNLVGGLGATNTGTTKAVHPRVYYPSGLLVPWDVAGAAPPAGTWPGGYVNAGYY